MQSITTRKTQLLAFDYNDTQALGGKRVAFVDDVVSTGGTLTAMTELLAQTGAELTSVLAVFTEGQERTDVIALGHLPYF